MRVHGTISWGQSPLHNKIVVVMRCSLNRVLKDQRLSEYAGLWDTCEEMYAGNIRSPLLLGVLIDMYQEKADTTHLNKALEASVTLSS